MLRMNMCQDGHSLTERAKAPRKIKTMNAAGILLPALRMPQENTVAADKDDK